MTTPVTTRMIVLSPHFPALFLPFWTRLWESGVQVIGVADTPWDDLPQTLRDHLHAYWKVEDMHNLQEMEHACQQLQKEHGEIHYIESLNEYWLETEAHLRSHLGVLGPNNDTIHRLKHKSHMQSIYQQADIPVPAGHLLTHEDEGRKWLEQVGYPVVAKPDVGVGAAGTYLLDGPEAYADFWLHKPDVAYFLQTFVSGDLYSFDGLVDHEGQVQFMACHRFNHGIMHIVNQNLDLQYYSLRDIPKTLMTLGQRTVKAFDLHSRFFHFEFFRQGEEQWVALEVNMRPPGGWTVDMFNYASDTSVFDMYADVILQKPLQHPTDRHFHVGYAGRKDKPYRHGSEGIKQMLGERLLKDAPIDPIFQTVLGQHGYMVRHPDLTQVQSDLALIQEQN